MADTVQLRMERMVDELDDLERRGLFKPQEIAEIVRKRRDFEFRIKRPSPLKQDFLDYIEYEKQIDELRKLRRRAIIGEMKQRIEEEEEEEEEEDANDDNEEGEDRKNNKKRKRRNKLKRKRGGKLWKRSISDVAGIARIIDIYRKVCARNKGDLNLWLQYLEFCRKCRNGRMKQALAQAIRFHPKVPGLWIYAASWEFDSNLNVAAARALMQGGLRACPDSEDLWIEYVRMELTYLNKLKARKAALGQDVKSLVKTAGSVEDVSKWKEENKDLFMPLTDAKESSEDVDNQEDDGLEKKENFFWEQGANILRTIYHGAIESIPTSIALRKRFLEILDSVDVAHSDELKEDVMEDMKKNFSSSEDYWDWLARLQVGDLETQSYVDSEQLLSQFKKAIRVYDDGLMSVSTVKMFSFYMKFLYEIVCPEIPGKNCVFDLEVAKKYFSTCLRILYKRAESSKCLTDGLALQYALCCSYTDGFDEARDVVQKLCDGKMSQSAEIWGLRLSMAMRSLLDRSTSSTDEDLNGILKLVKDALHKITPSKAKTICVMALKFFSNSNIHLQKLVDLLVVLLAKCANDDMAASISIPIVDIYFQSYGVKGAREMSKRLLALPHPSLALFRHCIELELNYALIGDGNSIVNARRLFESALSIYATNKELWKDYYSMEIKVGTSETVSAVYWRARKVLGDTTGLPTSDFA